jgi:hypothetical protein
VWQKTVIKRKGSAPIRELALISFLGSLGKWGSVTDEKDKGATC